MTTYAINTVGLANGKTGVRVSRFATKMDALKSGLTVVRSNDKVVKSLQRHMSNDPGAFGNNEIVFVKNNNYLMTGEGWE